MPYARTAAAALLLGSMALLPASAQDVTANPQSGVVRLRSGFTPDPHVVTLRSGGHINAATEVGTTCRGFITSAPNVRLEYQGGTGPLIISAASETNTTLVINGANGEWYCDDDTGLNGGNPAINILNAPRGHYEIWVGSVDRDVRARALLHISQTSAQ